MSKLVKTDNQYAKSSLAERMEAKQARAHKTAERIVTAANQLLNATGHFSNEAIAEKANVSVSSIYRYFKNRDELLGEMFRVDADEIFEHITAAIQSINTTNYRVHLEEIIKISADSVSGQRTSRSQSYGKISYDVAKHVSLSIHSQLHSALTEQFALICNCHPRYIDQNLVLILARVLVTMPKLLILENPDEFDQATLMRELTNTSIEIFSKVIDRAKRTHDVR